MIGHIVGYDTKNIFYVPQNVAVFSIYHNYEFIFYPRNRFALSYVFLEIDGTALPDSLQNVINRRRATVIMSAKIPNTELIDLMNFVLEYRIEVLKDREANKEILKAIMKGQNPRPKIKLDIIPYNVELEQRINELLRHFNCES